MKKWNLATAGLALCVNLLAPLAALGGADEVSTARSVNAVEAPAMASWEAAALTETVLPVKRPLAVAVETALRLTAKPLQMPEETVQMPEETVQSPEETVQSPAMQPVPLSRYAGVSMSEEERRELAAIVFLESANQCAGGQQAVAEVVLNRVVSPDFPDTVHDVLHEGEGTPVPQFSTIVKLDSAEPLAAQYAAIDAALYGPSILPEDVVFFSRDGENDRVWGKIQDHVFCYAYIWE